LDVLERAELIDFIASGERSPDQWTVGTEYEKHVVDAQGRPLPYASDEGGPSIRGLLEALADHRGWGAVMEGDHLVALQKNGASVSLEPGGQIELSGAPMATLGEMSQELTEHVDDLAFLTRELGVRWLWSGLHPVAKLESIPWMPKKRYVIMRRYLPTRGALAHYMMKNTATVQANLDFGDEDDMGHKLRTSMALSSLVTALFANSPAGVPGLDQVPSQEVVRSWRWRVWNETDPDRCGLLPWVFEGDAPTYEQWVDYALDVPMFLLEKQGQIVDMAGQSFRTYAAQGFGGHEPVLDDWALHLSTLFPDVRLKTYMEMRSADCVPAHLIPALPALWKGLLYDGGALDAAWDLVKGWSFDERREHRESSCIQGLSAAVPGKSYRSQELATELIAIARAGLPEGERGLLDGLSIIASSGRTLADETLEWISGATRTQAEILEHYEQQ
jgi:glutamate--cysteine ligase